MNEWERDVESGRAAARDESPEPLTIPEVFHNLGVILQGELDKFKHALVVTGRAMGKTTYSASTHMSGVAIDIQIANEINRLFKSPPPSPPPPIVPIILASCRVSSVPVGSACVSFNPTIERQGPLGSAVGHQGYRHPRATLAEQITGIRSIK